MDYVKGIVKINNQTLCWFLFILSTIGSVLVACGEKNMPPPYPIPSDNEITGSIKGPYDIQYDSSQVTYKMDGRPMLIFGLKDFYDLNLAMADWEYEYWNTNPRDGDAELWYRNDNNTRIIISVYHDDPDDQFKHRIVIKQRN